MKKLMLLSCLSISLGLGAMDLFDPSKQERTGIDDIHNVDQVIKVFGTLVKLARDEKFLPCSSAWFLQRVALKDNDLNKITALGSVTPQDLAQVDGSYFLDPDGDQQTYAGQPLQEGKVAVPMYYNFKVDENEKGANLQSIYLYAFNGATPFLKFWKPLVYGVFNKSVGDHEFDAERTTFRLKFNEEKGDWEIVRGYYSHHGSGLLVERKHITFEDTHPVVYAATYGHASYPDTFCLNSNGDTVRGNGARWEGWNKYEVLDRINTPANQKWIKYAGRWGVDVEQNPLSKGTQPAPTGLAARGWFADVDQSNLGND